LKKRISILLLLLAAIPPLLAADPCQVECSVPIAGPNTTALHGGQHAGLHSHANHARQAAGASASTSNCSSHVAAAIASQAYLHFGPEKSRQAVEVVVREAPDVSSVNAFRGETLCIPRDTLAFPAGATSLRI